MSSDAWRSIESAPRAKFGETWSPKFLLGRVGMEESVAFGRYVTALNGDQILEVFCPPGVRRHEDIPFTHWQPLPHCPATAQPQQDDGGSGK